MANRQQSMPRSLGGKISDLCQRLIGGGKSSTAAAIVAHPDDETLWAGGQILTHPQWQWFVLSLCRGSDPDRAPKFWKVLDALDASGAIADLDDGPDQSPLDIADIQQAILWALPQRRYDYILTHAPHGEYTRHRRHEEVSRAVTDLWLTRRLDARFLVMFAYHDDQGQRLPRARQNAHIRQKLDDAVWHRKYDLIRQIYGFAGDSWEARVTPRTEAFWCFRSPDAMKRWLASKGGHDHEGSGAL